MSAGDDDLDMGPRRRDMSRKGEAVHPPTKIDVRKQQHYGLIVVLKQLDRLLAIHDLMTSEASPLENVAGFHKDEGVIIDGKRVWHSGRCHLAETRATCASCVFQMLPPLVAQHEDNLAAHLIHFQRALNIVGRQAAEDLSFGNVDGGLPMAVEQGHGSPAGHRFRLVNRHLRLDTLREALFQRAINFFVL